jgi:hypothetical protein
MNPYLEQVGVWKQFHQQFCTRFMELLVPQVRPEFFVKIEEHVYVHDVTEQERILVGFADVSVTRPEASQSCPHSPFAILEAPLEIEIPIISKIERVPYLEVRDREDRLVVTVIELLSPTNKRIGDDRNAFLAKRRNLLRSDAHYVEIDLLRGGPRLPLKDEPSCDYYVIVSRAERRPMTGMWPLRLRDRLPEIPIPLREPHAEARIDLQAILHHVYDVAGYEDYLYQSQPQPRLHPEDEAWARQLISMPPSS